MLTVNILQECLPRAKLANLEKFVDGINQAFDMFDITSPERIAMFLAQTAHESANFSAVEENLNYSAKGLSATWPTRFPAAIAAKYARNPELIANRAYCDRMGNGNESSGDGWMYRGRGIIQLTGKSNYIACGDALGLDLVFDPDQASLNPIAVLSAGWFWDVRKLNQYCDQGNVKKVTQLINGGTLGLAERQENYDHILQVL